MSHATYLGHRHSMQINPRTVVHSRIYCLRTAGVYQRRTPHLSAESQPPTHVTCAITLLTSIQHYPSLFVPFNDCNRIHPSPSPSARKFPSTYSLATFNRLGCCCSTCSFVCWSCHLPHNQLHGYGWWSHSLSLSLSHSLSEPPRA